MRYVICNQSGQFLGTSDEWGDLRFALLVTPLAVPHFLANHRNCFAVSVRTVPRRARACGQRGMALLMELLIVCAVMLIIAATSVPAIYQLHLDDQQSDAKARVQRIAAAKAAIAICEALPTPPGCTPSAAVQALIPANGTALTVNGYQFTESTDGATYAATPINSQAGQQAYSVGANDVVMCGGSPCR